MCARLSLKVPRRRPLPARPLAAPGSDRAPAGCRAAARRFPKGARKTRSRQSASGPGAGGGAGGGGGADAGRRGAGEGRGGRPGPEGRSARCDRWESLVASPGVFGRTKHSLACLRGVRMETVSVAGQGILKLGSGWGQQAPRSRRGVLGMPPPSGRVEARGFPEFQL